MWHGMQAVEARREGAAARSQAFKRAQGANHLMGPVAARKLRAELAKVCPASVFGVLLSRMCASHCAAACHLEMMLS